MVLAYLFIQGNLWIFSHHSILQNIRIFVFLKMLFHLFVCMENFENILLDTLNKDLQLLYLI